MTNRVSGQSSKEVFVSHATGVGLAVATALSFTIAMFVLAYGPDPARSGSIAADSFSSSALGHRLLSGFLKRSGFDVSVQRAAELLGARPGSVIVVAEPGEESDFESHSSQLFSQADVHNTPILLVLPKWTAVSNQKWREEWVSEVRARSELEIHKILDEVGGGEVNRVRQTQAPSQLSCTFQGEVVGDIELLYPQYLKPKSGDETIASTREGVLIVRRNSDELESPLYIVSDPDLLNNHGLPRGNNVLVADRLFRDVLESRAVSFDEVVHGYAGPQSFLAELLRFPLVVAVFHGILLFGMVIWAGSVRFGKPRPSVPRLASGRRGLIDNTAKLLAYGGRIEAGALRYFEEAISAVGNYYHVTRDLTKSQLMERVQAISNRRGVEINLADVRQELLDLDEAQVNTSSRAVRLVSRVHHWREEMMDAT